MILLVFREHSPDELEGRAQIQLQQAAQEFKYLYRWDRGKNHRHETLSKQCQEAPSAWEDQL